MRMDQKKLKGSTTSTSWNCTAPNNIKQTDPYLKLLYVALRRRRRDAAVATAAAAAAACWRAPWNNPIGKGAKPIRPPI